MRKVKVNGVDVEVMTKAEQWDAPVGTVYVMVRVSDDDPRLVPAYVRLRRLREVCEDCSAVCWFDPNSWGSLPAHVARLCVQCVVVKAREAQRGGQPGSDDPGR